VDGESKGGETETERWLWFWPWWSRLASTRGSAVCSATLIAVQFDIEGDGGNSNTKTRFLDPEEVVIKKS
jgi:hypothetical protein